MASAHQDATTFIQTKVPNFKPRIGIILGSGLAPLTDAIENSTVIPFDDIPGFVNCSVEGHVSELHLGTLQGVPVICLRGRAHFYEGYFHANPNLSTTTMMTPIRTMKYLGCEAMLSTNSAGSMVEEVGPGHIMMIKDHINFQFNNPLVGCGDGEFGSRFVGLEDAYDPEYRQKLLTAAQSLDIELREGVFAGVLGPSFETPAEIRALRILGADLVGMSVIPEVITARHCGLRVAALSAITNLAAGMHAGKLSHDVTLQGAKLAIDKLVNLVLRFLESF